MAHSSSPWLADSKEKRPGGRHGMGRLPHPMAAGIRENKGAGSPSFQVAPPPARPHAMNPPMLTAPLSQSPSAYMTLSGDVLTITSCTKIMEKLHYMIFRKVRKLVTFDTRFSSELTEPALIQMKMET